MTTAHVQQAAHHARPTHTDKLMSVRPATWHDWYNVCRIECACFGMARLLFGLWPATLRPSINQRDAQVWVAEDDSHALGYLIAYKKALDGRMLTYVGGVGVSPQYRKSGIGTLLMRAVLAAGQPVWLHVRAGNTAALGLYHRLGMIELRQMPHFYSNGDHAVIMVTPPTH
jgi:ribosomal protein S18 acetylase RimI-like enzyme